MRNLKLTVVVSPELRRLIDAGAREDGRSTSGYTRRLLEEWAATVHAEQALPAVERQTATGGGWR
jgi:hypothetical protein